MNQPKHGWRPIQEKNANHFKPIKIQPIWIKICLEFNMNQSVPILKQYILDNILFLDTLDNVIHWTSDLNNLRGRDELS